MAFYSKIATLKYEDKDFKIVIPIRVKIAELTNYGHSKPKKGCPTGKGSLKDIDHYYRTRLDTKGTYSSKDVIIKNNYYPREMFDDKNRVLCPICKKPLDKMKSRIMKLYSSKQKAYIEIEKILSNYTLLRWKKSLVTNKAFSGEEVRTFVKNLTNTYRILKDSKKSLKDGRSKLIIHKGLTMKKLRAEEINYKGRKVIQAL